jgi:hypothetical protein
LNLEGKVPGVQLSVLVSVIGQWAAMAKNPFLMGATMNLQHTWAQLL